MKAIIETKFIKLIVLLFLLCVINSNDTNGQILYTIDYFQVHSTPFVLSKTENPWKTDINKNSNAIFFNSVSKSLNSELYVDYYKSWRFSLNGSLTTSDLDSVVEIQSFLSSGGNFIFNATLPIYYRKGAGTDNSYLGVFSQAKVATLINSSIASEQIFKGLAEVGLECQGAILGSKENIGLFLRLKAALCMASPSYLKNLLSDNRDAFFYGQANCGVILKNSYSISLSSPISAFGKKDPIDRVPVMIQINLNL